MTAAHHPDILQGYEEAQWSSYNDNDDRSGYGHSQGYHGNYDNHDYPDNYNNFGQDKTYYEDYGHRGGNNRRDYNDHVDRGDHGFQDHRKRHVASEPSPHVIFLGLDMDFTEADVRLYAYVSLLRVVWLIPFLWSAAAKVHERTRIHD